MNLNITRIVNVVLVFSVLSSAAFAQGLFNRSRNASQEQEEPENTVKPKAAVYIMGEPQGRNVLRMSVNNFLIQSGKYQMIAVDAIDVVAQEHERQMDGGVSDDEIAQLGLDAGAEYVFVVERTGSRRLEGKAYIAVRLVNVETKLATLSEMAEMAQGDETVDVVRKIINRMLGVNIPAPEKSQSAAAPESPPAQQAATVSVRAATAPVEDDVPQDSASQKPAPAASAHGSTWIREWLDGFKPVPMFDKPNIEYGMGVATVRNEKTLKNETWSMLLLGTEFTIWRFGFFLDLEVFLDEEFNVQNKGWNFKDDPSDAIFRKIRYIRFGQERDPLFVKFGGLESASIGHGIMVDRFTNMLYYPEEKLLGLQVNINDFSPIGLSLQTLISDFSEVGDDGGVFAGRVSIAPLKPVIKNVPLVRRLNVGASYAFDRDPYLGAQKIILNDSTVRAADSTRDFGMYGFDLGLNIIDRDFLRFTIYSQSAFRADGTRGWGIGMPGVALDIWRFNAVAEYRMTEGKFTHGFFDKYYSDERLKYFFNSADGSFYTVGKSQYIDSVSQKGIYGRLGMDIFGLLNVEGSLSYMTGKRFDTNGSRNVINRGYEATAGAGEAVMEVVPVLDIAEVYIRNTNIGMSNNFKYVKAPDGGWVPDPSGKLAGAFDRSPFMFWGYRAGIELGRGSVLIWDHRFGWAVDPYTGKLKSDNRVSLQAAYIHR